MNSKHPKAKKEKELADNARLLCAWTKFHCEQREAVLAGPYGTALTELFRMFANMKHVRPSQLVGYTRAIEWSKIDFPTRLVVLHEANAAITKLREGKDCRPSTMRYRANHRARSRSSARLSTVSRNRGEARRDIRQITK
jgi:hypothetical protein